MRSIRTLRRIIQDETGRSLRQATVKAIHGSAVDVQVGGSPKFLRGLSVIGGVDNVVVGDTVVLTEADGQVYAETTQAKAGLRFGSRCGASVGSGLGPHTHLGSTEGGILASYVRVDDDDTITAQHTFAPVIAQCPFLLGANAQSQLVIGLRADELNKSVLTGDGLSGGGILTADLTLAVDLVAAWSGMEIDGAKLRTDLDAEFAWTNDHSWDGDTLFVDVSEDSVYVNSTLPSTRGALTVRPAVTTQKGFVLKRPWSALGYNANLLAIIDENDNALITLTKQGDLESGVPSFVSGTSGWQIAHGGDAEFNNIVARGEMRASVFTVGEMHASGGTLMILEASKIASMSIRHNLCHNPSFEVDTARWFCSGTLTQDAAQHYVGSYSGKVVSAGQAWLWPSAVWLSVADGESISVQARVKSACDGSIHVYQPTEHAWTVERTLVEDGSEIIGANPRAGGSKASTAWTGDGGVNWQYLTVSWTNSTGATVDNITLVLEFDAAATSYVDAVQIQETAAPTNYFSGADSSATWQGTANDSASTQRYFAVDDPPSGHAALFDVGDILRVKTYTGAAPIVLRDNWLVVLATNDPGGSVEYWEYYVELKSGTSGTIPAGTAIASYGQAGDGYIKLTSDESYAPFIDIATHAGVPWTTITTHCRMGNLDGVLGLGEEWGIAAGKDLSSAAEPHIVMSDTRLRLWGVEQRWWDSSGNVRGEVDPSAGDADVMFWLGPSGSDKRFRVLGTGKVQIVSAQSGARMELTETGLVCIDGSGNTLIDLDASDASFTLKSGVSGDRMELDTAGLRFYDGADLLIDLNKTNATFSLKSAASGARMEMTATGLVFKNAGGTTLIDLDATDGSFTLKSATAGSARIEITNSEIVGYDGADAKQFYLSATTGKAYAGEGAVLLDEDGLTIEGQKYGASVDYNRIKFEYDDSGTMRGLAKIVAEYYDVGGTKKTYLWLQASRAAGDPWTDGALIVFAAIDGVAGDDVRFNIASNGTVNASQCTDFILHDGTRNYVDFTSPGDLILQLADNAGARKFRLQDSDGASMFYVDSNGAITGVSLTASGTVSAGTLSASGNAGISGDVRAGSGVSVGSSSVNPPTGCIWLKGLSSHPAAPANGVLLYHYIGGGRNALWIQWGGGTKKEIINIS